ncbi:MAG: PIN domain-containing protein [Armatimonadetes bacterium]|nr:PIN domain-containing protein [Armatimonadota bacterium]
MNEAYVSDTMGLVLRMEERRLSPVARRIFEEAEAGNAVIYVSAITLAEILYLSEKQRISVSWAEVEMYLNRFSGYREQPLGMKILSSTAEITDVPELHDRLIAGTARFLNLDLITNDPVIQASAFVNTLW